MRRPPSGFMAAFTLLTLQLACAQPQEPSTLPVTAVTDLHGAPLGSIALPISCAGEATTHLQRGLALLHNMTYAEAKSEFRVASELDENCALAYWGMAMSYVHPLWPDVPSAEALERGLALLTQARDLRPLTEHEEAYFAALEAYYRDGKQRSENERLASYAEGWAAAHSKHPEDLELQLFRSLGMIAAAGGSEQPVASQIEAGALAEEVLARIPDHTGALHYIIHAYDLPELAKRALPAARTYGEVAPENSHALHMTSHIFTRVGYWEESIRYNRRAAAAALKNPINGETSFHYLHAADYLAYALLQRLDYEGAREVLGAMAALDGPIFDHPASSYAFAAVPARLALERQDWEAASELQARWPTSVDWDKYPQFVALTEFARGLGAARAGHIDTAEVSMAGLAELRVAAAAGPGQYDWGTQVEIQELAVRAWMEYAGGNTTEALELMRRSAALEASTEKSPVTPGELLPATELLGDMLVELGQHADAVVAYSWSLDRSPNRANSLFGAGRAGEMSGDNDMARKYYGRFLESIDVAMEHPRIAHAKAFLENGRAAGQE